MVCMDEAREPRQVGSKVHLLPSSGVPHRIRRAEWRVREIGRPLKWLNMTQRMQQPQNICITRRLFGPKEAFQTCKGCNWSQMTFNRASYGKRLSEFYLPQNQSPTIPASRLWPNIQLKKATKIWLGDCTCTAQRTKCFHARHPGNDQPHSGSEAMGSCHNWVDLRNVQFCCSDVAATSLSHKARLNMTCTFFPIVVQSRLKAFDRVIDTRSHEY